MYEVAHPFINEGVWLKGEVERLSLQVDAKEKELTDVNKVSILQYRYETKIIKDEILNEGLYLSFLY